MDCSNSDIMKHLVIDNIGPIKHVELNLKRVNVIIGPQSVGKSCVLKIACFCAWAEKRIQLEQGKNGFDDFEYIEENLLEFHKLEGFVEKGKVYQDPQTGQFYLVEEGNSGTDENKS